MTSNLLPLILRVDSPLLLICTSPINTLIISSAYCADGPLSFTQRYSRRPFPVQRLQPSASVLVQIDKYLLSIDGFELSGMYRGDLRIHPYSARDAVTINGKPVAGFVYYQYDLQIPVDQRI